MNANNLQRPRDCTQLTISIFRIWLASTDLKHIGAKSGKCIGRKGGVFPSSDNDCLAADDGGIGTSAEMGNAQCTADNDAIMVAIASASDMASGMVATESLWRLTPPPSEIPDDLLSSLLAPAGISTPTTRLPKNFASLSPSPSSATVPATTVRNPNRAKPLRGGGLSLLDPFSSAARKLSTEYSSDPSRTDTWRLLTALRIVGDARARARACWWHRWCCCC